MEDPIRMAHEVQQVDLTIIFLYVVAAVAGLVGGSGAGAIMVLTSKRDIRIAQLLAYAFIGMIAAMLTLGFGYIGGIEMRDTAVLIRWSIGAGLGVPIALFSQNLAITAVLKKFGWELQFTMRRDKQDRRRAHLPQDHDE